MGCHGSGCRPFYSQSVVLIFWPVFRGKLSASKMSFSQQNQRIPKFCENFKNQQIQTDRNLEANRHVAEILDIPAEAVLKCPSMWEDTITQTHPDTHTHTHTHTHPRARHTQNGKIWRSFLNLEFQLVLCFCVCFLESKKANTSLRPYCCSASAFSKHVSIVFIKVQCLGNNMFCTFVKTIWWKYGWRLSAKPKTQNINIWHKTAWNHHNNRLNMTLGQNLRIPWSRT